MGSSQKKKNAKKKDFQVYQAQPTNNAFYGLFIPFQVANNKPHPAKKSNLTETKAESWQSETEASQYH